MTDAPMHVAVIGGGISGLAAAHRLIESAPPASIQVTVLESSQRFGGWVRTEPFADRPVDFGPDSLLMRTPWAAELCRELGIEDELVAPGAAGAFLLRGGKLRTLPSGILAGLPNGPLPFVRSGLLGPLGILRAAMDLVLPSSAPGGDESIGALVRRRLGAQTLERVIDPLLGGVHAGRCDDLSVAATAPQIAAAAQADRSLLRGLRKTARTSASAAAVATNGAAPQAAAPVFMGPRGGMQRIVDALVAAVGGVAELRLGASVSSVEPIRRRGLQGEIDGVRLVVDGDPEPHDFDGVILAVPAGQAARLLVPYAPQGATALVELRHASVAHTALAYDPADLPGGLPAGTGFLVPRGEGLLMTACTFIDQKWPLRRAAGETLVAAGSGASAPAGGDLSSAVVIKCSAGRIDDDRFAALSDAELVGRIHDELARTLGAFRPGAAPLASAVVRVPAGLPQYAPGHLERIDGLERELSERLPGLALAGNAYRGTSVPVCVRSGRAAADAQLGRLLPAS